MRTATRKSGKVTVTQQEVWKRGTARIVQTQNTASGKLVFDFVAADYVADGALFKITVSHALGHRFYLFDVFKTEDNTAINLDHYTRGDDELVLWFYDDVKDIRVIIDP